MNTLFRLWSIKLREQFDVAAYLQFLALAQADACNGYSYGVECIFRFYSYGLEAAFREPLYRDFESLVLAQHAAGGYYGLEKFWAFHSWGGIPADANVCMSSEVRRACTVPAVHVDAHCTCAFLQQELRITLCGT
jgi:hypothetical protein